MTYVEGRHVWEAAAAGKFSLELAQAACDAIDPELVTTGGSMQQLCPWPGLIIIKYVQLRV